MGPMDWIRMLLVARPYLEGFVEGWCEVSTPFPFVLLVVNGGYPPLTEELQSQCRTRKGCFSLFAHGFHPLGLNFKACCIM